MKKWHYSLLADSIFAIHVMVVFCIVFGWAWPELRPIYVLCLAGGLASIIFTGRCILTDLENQWRKQAGRPYNNEPFLTYWVEKLIGRISPPVAIYQAVAVGFYLTSFLVLFTHAV